MSLDEQRQSICPKCQGLRAVLGSDPAVYELRTGDPDCDVCHGAGMVSEAKANEYHRRELERRMKAPYWLRSRRHG